MDTTLAISQFAALAHPLRYQAFRLLVASGLEGLRAGDIAVQLDTPPSTLSSHLSQLERSGLIGARRDGVRIHYAINPAGVSALVDHLVRDCCDNRPELCGGAPTRQPDAQPALPDTLSPHTQTHTKA